MGLTVKEALQRLNLDPASVIGGKDGLARLIHRVNILEVPDIVQWLDGGELLLTTGFAIKDDPALQISLMEQLAEKNVAALAIKAGRYLTPVPQGMVELADELSLPLIELPAELPLSRVMAPIYEIILNQQLDQLKYTEKMHQLFFEIILNDLGITEIGNTLVDLIKNPVAIVDTRFQMLFNTISFHEELPWQDILNAVKNRARSYNRVRNQKLKMTLFHYKEWELMIYPIVNSKTALGYIVVLHLDQPSPTQESLACEQAALVTALEISKQQAIFNAECKNKEEIIEELLYSSIISEETIKRKARALDFSLEGELLIFVVEWNEGQTIFNQTTLIMDVEHTFADYPRGVLCHLRANQLTGLICAEDQPQLEQLLSQVGVKINAELHKDVHIGVGRACNDLKKIPQSYEEAQIAATIGRNLNKHNTPVFFTELGSILCLYEIKDSARAKSFYTETIGRLKEYDLKNQTQLLFTLETYFNNFCILRQTARDLYMHRNSVDYRLKKIVEITGKDFLSNPHDRFDLELALKLDYILATS